MQRQKCIVKISTGCKDLDGILGGGWESQTITELYGEYRTGKSQLCATACVTTQLPVEEGGGAGKVAYIDTEGTFRPDRLTPIASRLGMDPEAIAENVLCARASTFDQQEDLLDGLCAIMVQEPFKLLVVDSVMANLRADYCGRGELSERQQRLGQYMKRLKHVRLRHPSLLIVAWSDFVVFTRGVYSWICCIQRIRHKLHLADATDTNCLCVSVTTLATCNAAFAPFILSVSY